jgi:ethanolamine utilization protein EutS
MTEPIEKNYSNRIIQESVPGKEVTLIHLIANLDPRVSDLMDQDKQSETAIGIITISPSEAAIVVADLAAKSGAVTIGKLDMGCGSVVIRGDFSSVEYALRDVQETLANKMHFAVCPMTRT